MGYNKYNSPGWDAGFSSMQDALENYQKNKDLADNATAPDPTVDPGQNLGLISVANPNNNGPQQSEADGGERVDQPDVMVPNPAAQPGLSNVDPVAVAAKRTAVRANIYRKYGEDGEADKLLDNNASLGLKTSQARSASSAADMEDLKAGDARSVNDANQDVAQQVKAAGIDTSTPDGGMRANQLLVNALYKRGQPGAAKLASDQQLAMQTNSVKSQTEQRQVAANAIVNASRAGNLTSDLVSQFHDQFIPDGSTVKSTKMNSDGGFSMVLADSNGKESTQTVPGGKIADMYGMLGSADSAGYITAQLAAQSKLAVDKAAIAAHNASAGYSSALTAGAKQHNAQGAIENARGNDLWASRVAENSPEGSTDAQWAQIEASDDANISRRARVDPSGTMGIRAATQERILNAKEIDQLGQRLMVASATDKPALQQQMNDAMARRSTIASKLAALSQGDDPAPGLSTVVAPPAGGASSPPGGASAPPAKRPPLASFQR